MGSPHRLSRRAALALVLAPAAVATILACVSLAGAASLTAVPRGLYGGRAQTARNRHAAVADTARSLSRLSLPPGAALTRRLWRSHLHELEGATNHADAAQVWTVPQTMDATVDFLRAHVPPGSSVDVLGSTTTRGGAVESRLVEFAWPPLADVLGDRHLSVSVSPAAGGRSTVFVQAESIWLSARATSERIPVSTRSVVVRISRPGHPRPLRTIVVRASARVRRIVALWNAAEIGQPGSISCPEFPPPSPRTWTYDFAGDAGQPLARLTDTIAAGSSPGPCNPIAVTIGGRSRTALLGGPQAVAVQRMLGVRTAG